MTGLALEGVRHRYPDAAVDSVHAVDLEVASGGMLALVGPSGSGKSTLLRVAAGLEQPTAGRVLLGDRDVTALHQTPEYTTSELQRYIRYVT